MREPLLFRSEFLLRKREIWMLSARSGAFLLRTGEMDKIMGFLLRIKFLRQDCRRRVLLCIILTLLETYTISFMHH